MSRFEFSFFSKSRSFFTMAKSFFFYFPLLSPVLHFFLHLSHFFLLILLLLLLFFACQTLSSHFHSSPTLLLFFPCHTLSCYCFILLPTSFSVFHLKLCLLTMWFFSEISLLFPILTSLFFHFQSVSPFIQCFPALCPLSFFVFSSLVSFSPFFYFPSVFLPFSFSFFI
jgi:hypothetical protein